MCGEVGRDPLRPRRRDGKADPLEPTGVDFKAVLIPTTSPLRFTSGPPELPGLIAASVWSRSSYIAVPIPRPLPLMIPAVTVSDRPKGWPIASTQSPVSTSRSRPIRPG